jgi:hypothetical protein
VHRRQIFILVPEMILAELPRGVALRLDRLAKRLADENASASAARNRRLVFMVMISNRRPRRERSQEISLRSLLFLVFGCPCFPAAFAPPLVGASMRMRFTGVVGALVSDRRSGVVTLRPRSCP